MNELNLTYGEIRLLRNLMIEELSTQFSRLGVEHMILIEHMIQTIILAKISKESVGDERLNFKKPKLQ